MHTCTCTEITMVVSVWEWVYWNSWCQGWACFLSCLRHSPASFTHTLVRERECHMNKFNLQLPFDVIVCGMCLCWASEKPQNCIQTARCWFLGPNLGIVQYLLEESSSNWISSCIDVHVCWMHNIVLFQLWSAPVMSVSRQVVIVGRASLWVVGGMMQYPL